MVVDISGTLWVEFPVEEKSEPQCECILNATCFVMCISAGTEAVTDSRWVTPSTEHHCQGVSSCKRTDIHQRAKQRSNFPAFDTTKLYLTKI